MLHLLAQTSLANSCSKFINGQHPAQFDVYVVDIYGRRSNTITKSLKIHTAGIVYSSVRPVKLTNTGQYMSTTIVVDSRGQNKLLNLTMGDPA